ncbi:MAG: hypothetical protein EXR64_00180 [Dehalococcoidia bacterium]|nr:hypothetical protein [Dehalococcoidia bacterium]
MRAIGMPRGLLVRVDADARPVAIARRDRRGARDEARVEQIEEIWRIAEAWWREVSQARTYYRVILEGGRPLTLFRDDATGAWFEQPYSAPQNAPEGAPR